MATSPKHATGTSASPLRQGSPSPLRDLTAPFRPGGSAAIARKRLLESVYCTSGSNCWAVGSTILNSVETNQALHFNGKNWSRVATPSPGGTEAGDGSRLDSVRCTSPANCWAVGTYDKDDDVSLSQALHWNGTKWSVTATPAPGGKSSGDFNDLFDVACTSAVNCWADGEYGGEVGSSDESFNLALHWNGRKWSRIDTPNPAGVGAGRMSGLEAIRCRAPGNCWGVGGYGKVGTDTATSYNEVLHWNGRKWAKVNVPSPGKLDMGDKESGLNDLSCTSAKSCWAVGADTGTTRVLNESLHWNGKKWAIVGMPDPSSGKGAINDPYGISCTAGTNCWAVGEAASGATLNEALHWTGHKWSAATVPEPAGTAGESQNDLIGVRCVTAGNCWAVGFSISPSAPERDQILHWAGKKWAVAG